MHSSNAGATWPSACRSREVQSDGSSKRWNMSEEGTAAIQLPLASPLAANCHCICRCWDLQHRLSWAGDDSVNGGDGTVPCGVVGGEGGVMVRLLEDPHSCYLLIAPQEAAVAYAVFRGTSNTEGGSNSFNAVAHSGRKSSRTDWGPSTRASS